MFDYLPLDQQTEVVETLGTEQMVGVLNGMAPDDRTRLLEELPAEVTKRALSTLTPEQMKVARQLLGYPEGSAGRFMTPKYLAVRPELDRAAGAGLRARARARTSRPSTSSTSPTTRALLLDDIRLGVLVLAKPDQLVSALNDASLVSIPATATRDEVVATFEKYDRIALPVTDSRGVLVGMITVDDVLDVAEQKATEEIQGLGGVEALDAPYFDVSFGSMVRKRGGWLSALFLGEMLTATAMSGFEAEIEKAVVLTLFLPLIISSGGNSGSQATSIIIRSLALREVRLRDWWRVCWREIASGLALGLLLGTIGFIRIVVWAKVVPPLRRALPPGGDHRGAEPGGGGALREPGRLDAALPAPAAGIRPGEGLGALRGDAGGRERAHHLLHHREPDSPGHAALGGAPGVLEIGVSSPSGGAPAAGGRGR